MLKNNKLELYITENEIKQKIDKYANKINHIYQGKTLYCIGLMNGSLFFMSDLLKNINTSIVVDTMSVSSYNYGTKPTKIIKLYKNISKNITNQDVLLIEDIIDTGNTLKYVIPKLKKLHPKTLRIVCLVDKINYRDKFPFKYDSLLTIENKFLVGYGLDYNDKYRQLKDIYIYHE